MLTGYKNAMINAFSNAKSENTSDKPTQSTNARV